MHADAVYAWPTYSLYAKRQAKMLSSHRLAQVNNSQRLTQVSKPQRLSLKRVLEGKILDKRGKKVDQETYF